MKRVFLDVDGVLADFVSAFLIIVQRETNVAATPEQVTQFDICASLKLTSEQAARVKKSVGSWPRLARHLNVLPGAIEGVKRLQEVADVYVVTSPWNSNETWTHDRESWLREKFGIPHSRVTHTSQKHLMRGDFLVDDKTETLRKWNEHNGGGAIQWETPHNRNDGWLGPATNNWHELAELVARRSA